MISRILSRDVVFGTVGVVAFLISVGLAYAFQDQLRVEAAMEDVGMDPGLLEAMASPAPVMLTELGKVSPATDLRERAKAADQMPGTMFFMEGATPQHGRTLVAVTSSMTNTHDAYGNPVLPTAAVAHLVEAPPDMMNLPRNSIVQVYEDQFGWFMLPAPATTL